MGCPRGRKKQDQAPRQPRTNASSARPTRCRHFAGVRYASGSMAASAIARLRLSAADRDLIRHFSYATGARICALGTLSSDPLSRQSGAVVARRNALLLGSWDRRAERPGAEDRPGRRASSVCSQASRDAPLLAAFHHGIEALGNTWRGGHCRARRSSTGLCGWSGMRFAAGHRTAPRANLACASRPRRLSPKAAWSWPQSESLKRTLRDGA